MKGFALKTDYTDLIDLLSMENGVEILFQIIRKDIDAEREDCDE